jgi:hypothetical protein
MLWDRKAGRIAAQHQRRGYQVPEQQNITGAEGTVRKDAVDVRAFVRAADCRRPWREKSVTRGEINEGSICACACEFVSNRNEICGPFGGLTR